MLQILALEISVHCLTLIAKHELTRKASIFGLEFFGFADLRTVLAFYMESFLLSFLFFLIRLYLYQLF